MNLSGILQFLVLNAPVIGVIFVIIYLLIGLRLISPVKTFLYFVCRESTCIFAVNYR